MDLGAVFKLKRTWEKFTENHPRVPGFVSAVGNKGACENMEIAVAIRYPDGEEFKTGVRLTQEDIELLNSLQGIKG